MTRTVRLFRTDDQQAVAALCRSAVVDAKLPLSVDRSPDFTLLDRLSSSQWDIIVVEENGQMVAFADLVHLSLPYTGGSIPATYGRLGGIRPDMQGKGIFRDIIAKTYELMNERGSRLFLGLVNENNWKMERALGSKKIRDPWILDRRLVIQSVLLVRRYRAHPRYICRRARSRDIPELADLLSRHYHRYLFGPVFSEVSLSRLIDRLPDFSVQDILVAEDQRGRLAACAGFWDQSRARRIRVGHYGLRQRLLAALWNALACCLRLPRFPRPGEELKMLFTTLLAESPEHPGAMSALWRDACNRFLRCGYHFYLVAGFQGDPLLNSLRSLWKLTSFNRFRITSGDAEVFELLQKEKVRLPHLEYAMC